MKRALGSYIAMDSASNRKTRLAVVCEYTAGHATFFDTLELVAAQRNDLEVTWLPVGFEQRGLLEHLPPLAKNWSVRASLRARHLASAVRSHLDAALVHTQTAALALSSFMRTTPTLISLDATPEGWDAIGGDWGHKIGSREAEAFKKLVVKRALGNAVGLVAWTDWVRRSLVDSYAVAPERIRILPSGVRLFPLSPRRTRQGPVRLLFVGRDFSAKGGDDLIRALETLEGWELDVVTHSQLPPRPGVRIHTGLTPGCEELRSLYARADIAVLPSRGDCSPFAILEAMSAGLPVLSTDVGAIGEMVSHGITGFLVRPRDTRAIAARLACLLADGDLRDRLGKAGRRRVEQHYDAERNANELFDMLVEVARRNAAR